MLFLPLIKMLMELIAKAYLAQVFYTDASCVAIASVWHADRADAHDKADVRSAELSGVAEALQKASEDRREKTRRAFSTSKRGRVQAAV